MNMVLISYMSLCFFLVSGVALSQEVSTQEVSVQGISNQGVSIERAERSISSTSTLSNSLSNTDSNNSDVGGVLIKKIQFTFKNETYQNLQTANQQGGVLSDNQIRLEYRIHEKMNVGFIAGGLYNFTGSNDSNNQENFSEQDLALLWNHQWGPVLEADSLSMEARVYLPTSRNSQSAGQSTRWLMEMLLAKNFGNGYSASFYFGPNYYFMNRESQQASYFDSLTSIRGTYNFTSKSDIYLSLDHTYNSFDQTQKMAKENLGPQLGVEYKWNSHLQFIFDVEQSHNINQPQVFSQKNQYALFDAYETSYRFIGLVNY